MPGSAIKLFYGVKGANSLLRHKPEGPGFSQATKACPKVPSSLPKAGVKA
jgi:hypothetical protein